MASLADLFNPTFLMFLGILVLVAALLVVYFESKMRDQNHKIASMLSLVSTLAEDLNGVKMGVNHLAHKYFRSDDEPEYSGGNNLEMNKTVHVNNLIEVSDDESDAESNNVENNDEDNTSVEDSENNDSEYDEYESDSDNVKVLKINISQNEAESENNSYVNELADLDGEFEPIDDVSELANEYVEEVLDLKYDSDTKEEIKEDDKLITSSDLKTISINLGEENNLSGSIDYKKLQLPKLRSIVTEKGLATSSDAAKLKKNELLKLLGVE